MCHGNNNQKARCSLFVVLGMHRSGTSCVSSCLNGIGVNFEACSLVPGDANNEHGYWEAVPVHKLNDAILLKSGGSWEKPPEKLQWSRWQRFKARSILRKLTRTRFAGFKDPRTTLTYELWQTLLPPHVIVACFRHPLAVAKSLQSRDGWPIEQGIALWTAYNELLLRHTENASQTYWVNFDEGKVGVENMLLKLANDFAIPMEELHLKLFDENLQHHKFSEADQILVNQYSSEVYQKLVTRAGCVSRN